MPSDPLASLRRIAEAATQREAEALVTFRASIDPKLVLALLEVVEAAQATGQRESCDKVWEVDDPRCGECSWCKLDAALSNLTRLLEESEVASG